MNRTLTIALATCLSIFTTHAHAGAVISTVVTFTSDGFGANDVDTVATVPSIEIQFGDGTNIGDNDLLDDEFIDIDATSVTLRLQGDGGAHSPGFTLLGWNAPDNYMFDFSFDTPTDIIGVTVDLTDVVGVAVGSEVTVVDSNTVKFIVGTLGVKDVAGVDLGTVKINLQTSVASSPIPEPSSLLLFSALGSIGFFVRRRRALNTN